MNDKKPAPKRGNKKPLTNNSAADLRPGLAARLCAARLLGAVIEKNTSLDGLTDNTHGHPQYLALEPRDRALVRAILGSALRNRGSIERAINKRLDRPLPENAVALKHLLHVAIAQIFYLDLPDHSAVDLAVEAANSDPRNRKYAGLVNALLRRLSRNKERALAHSLEPETNVPEWFAKSITDAYGADKAAAILAMHAYEPPIDFTVKGDAEAWAEKLGGVALPNGSVRLQTVEGNLTDLPGFAEGDWWVQDVAASLPARLMGDIKGKRVADLCAAPGGKTAQLVLQGADVTALDLSENRLKRLRGNLERLGFEAKTVATNLMDFQPDELFDAVLLDAPCSSTGTVRRHPDVPWTKTPQDIAKLAELQGKLLAHAATLVKPGGVIVFSNCSLHPLEGEEMARKAAENPLLEPFPITDQDCSGLEGLVTAEGFLRSTPADLPPERFDGNPHMAGMDGFFAARFKRRA
ncbi:RsmB/NOP family class I SAM-dependent RNA methyltransferase [Brucella intermedia]|uniref:RsmB/NOP family class I SAM-dependent RNA methyltransferase n=1 Tax=Brucella intermedia TaxID=94625 RepID=UPI00046A24F5|nr:RsmB/NOP family class I SAM-dependent RNA methyltransferase [Brucella intermedia]UXO82708.1 methyltransferase domain-containing protein [Brucella intermedia]WGJ06323.1 RsmB/NOP family class I SAM-dependent RNA methyltransferase [Brucella intermedia]